MKILKPVARETIENRRSKYNEIRQILNTLKDGQWLPIRCENYQECYRARMSICNQSQGGHGKYEGVIDTKTNTLYLRPKEEK